MFSFQALYAGLAPHQAPGLYAVIGYLDAVAGVWFPRGGIHAVPRAMAAAAAKHGVRFRYGTTVCGVDIAGDRATGVLTTGGERIPADVVVLNPDLPTAYRKLLGETPPRTVSNVVFVGSGTQPGVGVPMVLISGKLAAQRITG